MVSIKTDWDFFFFFLKYFFKLAKKSQIRYGHKSGQKQAKFIDSYTSFQ